MPLLDLLCGLMQPGSLFFVHLYKIFRKKSRWSCDILLFMLQIRSRNFAICDLLFPIATVYAKAVQAFLLAAVTVVLNVLCRINILIPILYFFGIWVIHRFIGRVAKHVTCFNKLLCLCLNLSCLKQLHLQITLANGVRKYSYAECSGHNQTIFFKFSH